jgi:hypothetical protein
MLPEWTAVGFSGHRKLENPDGVAEGIQKTLARLQDKHGPLLTISSAASGADTLFLEEVSRKKLPFRIVLPFERKVFERDFDPQAWQRVLPLLDQALFVQEISGIRSRKEAFLEAGVLSVEAADVMIFVWDGKPAAGIGGTGDVVDYARALGKPLIIIDAATGNVVAEEALEKLPPRKTQTNWNENPRAAVEERFQEFRKGANRRAPLARHLIIWVIVLQLGSSAIGIFGLTENAKGPYWNSLELLVLIVAGILVVLHRNLQHDWIENRLRTELCRSFLAIWSLPRGTSFFPCMLLRGCEKLSRSLQIAWYLDRSVSCSFEEVRDGYLVNRIEGQLNFFKRSYERARRYSRIMSWFAWATAAAAIGFSAIISWLPHWAHIVSVMLPMLSAALLTLLVSREHSRRGVLYQEMALGLDDLRKRFEATRNWAGLFRLVTETEECLLYEVAEWYSFVRFTGVLH